MQKMVYVGLSGPTYYDYRNKANKTTNDKASSPNPILENAFGLAVFYDEIWFLCESLCPQSLREHPKVNFVDRMLFELNDRYTLNVISDILNNTERCDDASAFQVMKDNTRDYWDGVDKAGVSWWSDKDRAIDTHTHALNILDVSIGATSNYILPLQIDLGIVQALRHNYNVDIALNSFSKNLYKILYPSQFDLNISSAATSQLGTCVINAKISNSMNTYGPCIEVFDKIFTSSYVGDFKNYISAKKIDDAGKCYLDVVNEIDTSIKNSIQKFAQNSRPIRGIVNILIDTLIDVAGLGSVQKAGQWYLSATSSSPTGAAAFLLDLKMDV